MKDVSLKLERLSEVLNLLKWKVETWADTPYDFEDAWDEYERYPNKKKAILGAKEAMSKLGYGPDQVRIIPFFDLEPSSLEDILKEEKQEIIRTEREHAKSYR